MRIDKRRVQSGVALLLFLLLVLSSVTLYRVSLPAAVERPAYRLENSLAKARSYLLSYLLGHAAADENVLPYPDRDQDVGYDGIADCVSPKSTTNPGPLPHHLLGQYPWRGDLDSGGCVNQSLGIHLHDSSAANLWYAVSPRLVEHYDCSINPCPWLTLRDGSGRVISDQVAFLLIAPGPPLVGQQRLAGSDSPSDYLESYTLSATESESNFDADLSFIAAPVSDSFNDTILFVSVDQLCQQGFCPTP